MTTIDQSGIRGKTRDRPIGKELETVLMLAGRASGIDTIFVTSGGQPGTTGQSTGSTRHNGGRAADLHLGVEGRVLGFDDQDADELVKRFVIAAAANGATGIGAGVRYMGNETLHVGFGKTPGDRGRLVWGAGGRAANAPQWLRDAAREGWDNPPQWALAGDEGAAEDLPEDQDEIFSAFEEPEISIPIPKRFSLDVINAAQATQDRWGVPASVTLAQWALESRYGASMPVGSNNPFGIKAVSGQPFVEADEGKRTRAPGQPKAEVPGFRFTGRGIRNAWQADRLLFSLRAGTPALRRSRSVCRRADRPLRDRSRIRLETHLHHAQEQSLRL
jgi:hypothetical protein